jgi:hypothetical protein
LKRWRNKEEKRETIFNFYCYATTSMQTKYTYSVLLYQNKENRKVQTVIKALESIVIFLQIRGSTEIDTETKQQGRRDK